MPPHDLTIVVTSRDNSQTIVRAIESVKKAGYPILLADNHSKDNTVALAREAGEGHVTVLRPVDKRGLGNVRQSIVENVDSPYIACLEAQDAFLPGRIERLEYLLKAGADLVFDSVEYCATPAKRLGLVKVPAFLKQPRGIYTLFERNHIPSIACPGIRTAFALSVGYNTKLDRGADYDFLLRALRAGPKLALSEKFGYRKYIDPTERLSVRLAEAAAITAEGVSEQDPKEIFDFLVLYGLGEREAAWKMCQMATLKRDYRGARAFLARAFPKDADPHAILEPNHPDPRKEGWKHAFYMGTIDLLQNGEDEKDWLIKTQDYAQAPEAYNNRAVACSRRGDLVNARKFLEGALSLFPNYVDAAINLKSLSTASRITNQPLRPRS